MIEPAIPLVMEDLLAHSFKDFHRKGFDYVCLKRSELETIKVYFFDGDCRDMPEVVSPHDHRYDFLTMVLAGTSANLSFCETTAEDPKGEIYQAFDYRTPLNGGSGFTWREETHLRRASRDEYRRGDLYHLQAEALHTIAITSPQTILCLKQGHDRMPLNEATTTFTRDREPPSLSGLYSKFTADQMRERINTLNRLAGFDLLIKAA